MRDILHRIPRFGRALLVLVSDLILVPFALYAALVMRLNDLLPLEFWFRSLPLLLLLLIAYPVLFYSFQLHRIKLSGFDVSAVTKTVVTVFALSLIGFVSNVVLSLGSPRTVPIIFMLSFVMLVLSSRLVAIYVIRDIINAPRNRLPVAVFGAGQAGVQLILALKQFHFFHVFLFSPLKGNPTAIRKQQREGYLLAESENANLNFFTVYVPTVSGMIILLNRVAL